MHYLKLIRNFLLIHTIWRKYRIARGFHAGARVRLWAKKTLVIGRDFYIGRDSFIETDCIIGDYVIFGNRVSVVGKYDHCYQQIGVPVRIASAIRDKDYAWKGLDLVTRIGNDVWVGCGAIVMQGVTIGDGAVVAAGAIVTKDVEPYSIYAGNPARKIRVRFEHENDLEAHLQALNSQKKHP